MISLTVLCEGPTEADFVTKTLKPHLSHFGVFAKAVPLSRQNFGVVSWSTLYRAVKPAVGNARSHEFTTCLIDLYALPADYCEGIEKLEDPVKWAQAIEARMWLEMPNPQWIPHLQVHEFEAMIFVDIDAIPHHLSETKGLESLRRDIGDLTPEQINCHPTTAPSKRLLKFLPAYAKAATGPAIVAEIGLERIRSHCPHFNAWLSRIEALGHH